MAPAVAEAPLDSAASHPGSPFKQKAIAASDEHTDDPEIRALGIIIAYATSRLSISLKTLSENIKAAQFNALRFAKRDISSESVKLLRQRLHNILNSANFVDQIKEDWPFLESALRSASLTVAFDSEKEPIHRSSGAAQRVSEIEHDKEFLRALDIEPDQQSSRVIHRAIGGLWYVIRRSTPAVGAQSADEFNISLLNVKPTHYWRLEDDGSYTEVETGAPHFSLRARSQPDETVASRGRVIAGDSAIYFVGNTKQGMMPKLVTMAWRMPGGDVPATKARGLILTVSANSVTVAAPVVAVRIPVPMTAASGTVAYDQEASTLIKSLIDQDAKIPDSADGTDEKYSGRIGAWSDAVMEEKFKETPYWREVRQQIKQLSDLELSGGKAKYFGIF